MNCVIRSADRTLVDRSADRIVARSPHGEFAVMDGHAPILAVLVPGVIRLQSHGEEHIIVCKGGTFSLADNTVTILVERPYTLEEIVVDSLRNQLVELQAESSSPPDLNEIAYLELLCRVKESHA